QEFGYHPEIILAGRRLNDSMGEYVASQIIKLMVKKDIRIKGAKVLVLGITFKENCPDVRNTRAVDVIRSLRDYGTEVTIHDPWADPAEVLHEYGLTTLQNMPTEKFDAVILTVAHKTFMDMELRPILNENGILYDVKGVVEEIVEGCL